MFRKYLIIEYLFAKIAGANLFAILSVFSIFNLVVADDFSDLQLQILESNGNLVLQAGTYYLDQTLEFDLARLGASSIRCEGAVTLVMNGPGPAIQFVGSHQGTASPTSFNPETWRERMPLIDGLVLTGNTFFTSMPQDLVVQRSERVIVNGNTFNPRQEWSFGGIVFRDSWSCLFTNNTVHAFRDPIASILFERCQNSRISNCILTDIDRGIVLRECTNCSVEDTFIAPPNKGGETVQVIEGGK